MIKAIPEEAVLRKEGLFIVEGTTNRGTAKCELYSTDGWCFYDLTQSENYDEEGNLLPKEHRIYAQYMIMRKNDEYVEKNIVSVPIEEGYTIT